MKFAFRLILVGTALTLTACSQDDIKPPAPTAKVSSGINPQIMPGDVPMEDKSALTAWINEAVTLFKSSAFETNFQRAAVLFPDVFLSAEEDIIPSTRLLQRLQTQDPYLTTLWWPKAYVVLDGGAPAPSADRLGFGFEGSRKALAGPDPTQLPPQTSGQIEIGRLHFARYTQGDVVEKSCAMNTLIHEISHTLSDQPDRFWMHILDSQRGVTPPRGVFEASYFIGVIAQCTYLENMGRIQPAEFETCLLTFAAPSQSSRFRSSACDDFPNAKPITPQGRLRH